jgi:hypothetical protein
MMTSFSIAELRLAAKQARSLASSLNDPVSKLGFYELAAKWEAEAEALEAGKETVAFGSSTITFDPA